MIGKIKDFFQELQIEWEEWVWKTSVERKELAHIRLAAHRLAMEEGRNSPYTHPDDYTHDFVPINKLH